MLLPDGDTLLGKTAARAVAMPGAGPLVTVTNRELLLRDARTSTRRCPEARRPTRRSCSNHSGAAPPPPSQSARCGRRPRSAPDVPLLVLAADHLIHDQAGVCASRSRAPPRWRGAAGWSRSASSRRCRRPVSATSSAARRSTTRRSAGAGGRALRRKAAARRRRALCGRRQLRLEFGHVLLHAARDPRRARAARARGARRRARGVAPARRRAPQGDARDRSGKRSTRCPTFRSTTR